MSACCDDCAKSGGTCGDKKATWSVGSAMARVGQDPPPGSSAECVAWGDAQFKQGLTWGWVGGSALVILLWGGLSLARGR